ncbi:hypothetical protein [Streptomyces cinereospinus]|uniref:Cellulose synthase n=2 Tax=Streptomyces cinereospinus TaxID=285561 RepID=A0ABV5N013_9ACTN
MIAETVCSAVAAAGLGIAAVTAFRRRFRTAARIAAYALVPLGLVMTGVVQWAADTAFSPVAWAGFGVLGGAWLLLTATRAVERRRDRKGRAAGAAAPREAVAPQTSAPSLGQASRAAGTPRAQPQAAPRADAADDFSDIEAILKKHGI